MNVFCFGGIALNKSQRNTEVENKELVYIFVPMLLLIPIFFYNEPLYELFNAKQYVYFYLALQIIIIVFAMAIAIQTWLVFSLLQLERMLYVGVFFFIIAVFEWMIIIEAKNFTLPNEWQTSYLTIWFHLLIRLLLAIGFMLMFSKRKKPIKSYYRVKIYGKAIILGVGIWLILRYPPTFLRPIIVEGILQTSGQNILQFLAICLQIIFIVMLTIKERLITKRAILLISASVFLIISDLLFIVYKDPSAIGNVVALVYKVYANFFFVKAIFYESVERPYKQLLKIQQNLEQSKNELHYQVNHDDVTKLANERFLLNTLKSELQTGNPAKAIIAIEIDRLAMFRASLGIRYSNEMLNFVADQIKSVCPKDCLAAKLQEDQFVIYINHYELEEDIYQICDRLKNAIMKEPLKIQHFSLNCKLNIGVAFYTKGCGSEETILMQARLAMKEAGRHPKRLLIYTPSMSEGIEERLILEQDLHQALTNNEFFLEYQPQINLQNGHIESVEALIRWKHPTRGLISPICFIPIAEESGLIIQLGEWVIETACLQGKVWQKQGLPKIKIAVNLSMGQLIQQDLVSKVEHILLKTGFEANYLQLEITESMTMDRKQMTLLLRELKSLGVQIAVDDFGTGYSSLAYLKDFPIDFLKIDRAFVRNIQHNQNDKALVSMILSISKHLGFGVVAEGIEEVEQLAFFLKSDCGYIQGHLFSKPIPADQLTATFEPLQHYAKNILCRFGCEEEYII